MADIFRNTEPMNLSFDMKIINAEEFEKLIEDVRQKYEALQESIKRLNNFQLECKLG